MKVTVHDKETPIVVDGLDHLDKIIAEAVEQAKSDELIGVILLQSDTGNELGLAVGSEETVLFFNYGHGNIPYYASKGELNKEEPAFTCFLFFEHHTEFLRKWVIPFELGLLACHEFYNSGDLPKCIEWVET
jgi:hypothetical protein